jgi:hypothetical protein
MKAVMNRTGSCERGVDYTVFPMPKAAENEYVYLLQLKKTFVGGKF